VRRRDSYAAHHSSLDFEEKTAMTHESYKAWLDAMPIDDVRRRIERLEHKLSDLRVLERLHDEHHGGCGPESGAAEPAETDELGEAGDPSSPIGEDEPSDSTADASEGEHGPEDEHEHEHGSEHEHEHS
jgi:hypothetical protein